MIFQGSKHNKIHEAGQPGKNLNIILNLKNNGLQKINIFLSTHDFSQRLGHKTNLVYRMVHWSMHGFLSCNIVFDYVFFQFQHLKEQQAYSTTAFYSI